MAGLFTKLDETIDLVMSSAVSVMQTNLVSSITSILTISLTLYMIVFGYMILAGKIQAPFQELMWKMASFVILIAFMNNADGVLTLAGEAVNELSTIGSDGSAGVGFLDDQYTRMAILASKLADQADYGTGWFINGLVLLAYILMAIPIFSILLISKFTMFFLLAIAPIFIFCLMWGWLKDSFAQYLTALLSNALIIIVARTFQRAFFDLFDRLATLGESNVYFLTFCFVIFAWFSKDLLVFIIASVSKLLRVTADSFPSSFVGAGAREAAKNRARAEARENQRDLVQSQILDQLKRLNQK